MTIYDIPVIEPKTTDYELYMQDVYRLYKDEFNLKEATIDIKKRDAFTEKLIKMI